MATDIEAQRLLQSEGAATTAVKTGLDAKVEKFQDWLETPIGSRIDKPLWGNPILNYKHENLLYLINYGKPALVNKVIEDLGFDVAGISIAEIEIDMVGIVFILSDGSVLDATVKVK